MGIILTSGIKNPVYFLFNYTCFLLFSLAFLKPSRPARFLVSTVAALILARNMAMEWQNETGSNSQWVREGKIFHWRSILPTRTSLQDPSVILATKVIPDLPRKKDAKIGTFLIFGRGSPQIENGALQLVTQDRGLSFQFSEAGRVYYHEGSISEWDANHFTDPDLYDLLIVGPMELEDTIEAALKTKWGKTLGKWQPQQLYKDGYSLVDSWLVPNVGTQEKMWTYSLYRKTGS